jgi:hypothetical protein
MLNKQGVKSTSGFTLQRIERFKYEYREGDYFLHFSVEPGVNYEEIVINEDIQWLPPYEGEKISTTIKNKIMKNISDALDYMGIKYKLTRISN